MSHASAAPAPRPSIVPALTYYDAPAMLDWLERAFGFSRRLVVLDDQRGVRHAELTLGDQVIMVNSPRAEWRLAGPGTLGGTHASVCCWVADPDVHQARAAAAGAQLIFPVADREHGSRDYTARDPEGVIWTFGTYIPGAWWDGKGGA